MFMRYASHFAQFYPESCINLDGTLKMKRIRRTLFAENCRCPSNSTESQTPSIPFATQDICYVCILRIYTLSFSLYFFCTLLTLHANRPRICRGRVMICIGFSLQYKLHLICKWPLYGSYLWHCDMSRLPHTGYSHLSFYFLFVQCTIYNVHYLSIREEKKELY